jgi:hypothetical protein
MTWNGSPVPPGFPVPRTGGRGKWKLNPARAGKPSGVVGNSRTLAHHYIDEGCKGSAHNRSIRRRERVQWLSEVAEELNGCEPDNPYADREYDCF